MADISAKPNKYGKKTMSFILSQRFDYSSKFIIKKGYRS